MSGRRILVATLALAALFIWGRNAVMIWASRSDNGRHAKMVRPEKNPFDTPAYHYKADCRDPFFCGYFMTEAMSTPATTASVAKKKAPERVALPRCGIDGVVYSEKNPMILFRIGDKSVPAKQGDVVDSVTIKKIFKDSAVVVYKGTKFIIGK